MSEQDETDAPRVSQRESQRLATRARILAAATDLFAAHGYEGASLPAIASCCGVRSSLILYHFGTKQAVWQAVVDEVFAAVIDRVAAQATALEGLTGLDYFRAAIRVHLLAAVAEPNYHRILFQEAMQESDRLRWLVDRHQKAISDEIAGLIERAQEEGYLPRTLPPMHLKFIASGMVTLPFTLAPEYRLLTGDEPFDEAFIGRHIDACLAMLTCGHG